MLSSQIAQPSPGTQTAILFDSFNLFPIDSAETDAVQPKIARILSFCRLDDSTLKEFARSTKLMPSFLTFLDEMPNLRVLNLFRTPVNDDSLQHIVRFAKPESQRFRDTDESMKIIESYQQLQRLFINRTRETDEGVYPVSRWSKMYEITAVGTQVTRNGAEYGRRRVETRPSH